MLELEFIHHILYDIHGTITFGQISTRSEFELIQEETVEACGNSSICEVPVFNDKLLWYKKCIPSK